VTVDPQLLPTQAARHQESPLNRNINSPDEMLPRAGSHSPDTAVAPHRARVSTPPRIGPYDRLATARLCGRRDTECVIIVCTVDSARICRYAY
jgi:hypothetical protein